MYSKTIKTYTGEDFIIDIPESSFEISIGKAIDLMAISGRSPVTLIGINKYNHHLRL